MDQELRDALSTLLAQMAGVDANAREAASRSRETFVAVNRLESRVGMLEGAVFGSTPPGPTAAPVVARLTEGEGTVADLTGRLMALQASHEAHVRETLEYRKANDAKQDQQLEALGTIAKAVTGVTGNPLVQKIAKTAGVVLLLLLAALQARLQLHGVLP